MTNISSSFDRMHGVIEGVQYGQFQRTEELNQRIRNRTTYDRPLRPNFEMRSVATKYILFPSSDIRPDTTVGFNSYHHHDVTTNMTSMTCRGPPNEKNYNIDTDTILRNHHFPNQPGASQNVFIPSSKSELYNTAPIIESIRSPEQPFPSLFDIQTFDLNSRTRNTMGTNIGADLFFNNTRTQLRFGS